MKKSIILLFGLSTVTVLAGCNLNTSTPTNTQETKQQGAEKANPVTFGDFGQMPAFEVETLDGKTITDQTLLTSGKPTLIYFTASRCPVCAKNRPSINAVYPDFKDDVNIVSISIDASDTKEIMQELADDKGLTYPMTPGYPQVMIDFGVKSQATTVAVDKNGKIIFMANKKKLTEEEYRALLTALVTQ